VSPGRGIRFTPILLTLTVAVLALLAPGAASADAGEATWRLEQPAPPTPPTGVQGAGTPIGLGHVGDVEFLAPNRGLLITSGNGSTIPAGVWAYDGGGWKQLATVCGATDGRIAWAGENEFWTVSDGRPGQTRSNEGNRRPPLEDDTLCHFADGRVANSYASLAFQSSSYQAMHGAACLAPDDCWFAGDPLPGGQATTGSFHLHWNGGALVEEPFEGGQQGVQDMREFHGRLYESVRVTGAAREQAGEVEPPVLHAINPAGASPTFEGIPGVRDEPESTDVPLYGPGVFVEALNALELSADAAGLWAATGPVRPQELPEGSNPGQVTIARLVGSEGVWRQLLGPSTNPSGAELFGEQVVQSIAAEAGGEGAWVALDTQADAHSPSPETLATIAHISADGTVSEVQTLPSQAERERGIGPKGAGQRITCPAAHDCWLVTTQGWLYHLTTGDEGLSVDDEGFSNLITSRPADEGLPRLPPDAPPQEEVAQLGELPILSGTVSTVPPAESRVTVPLLSAIHSRVVHGTTLELSFHLAARARVRLIAKRGARTVASTSLRTFAAGNRRLTLKLDAHRWPTRLALQTHALAPLPTVSTRSPSVETVSTRLAFPNTAALVQAGSLF
jgi:hypothetical protein